MKTSFTVSNPTLKTSILRNYTSYEIKSTSTEEGVAPGEHLVQRRYRDFLWLHETLRERNSGCIIPPLPKKQFLGRFDPKFIESRIRGIDQFLRKVLTHPILAQEVYVNTFLEVNDISQAKKAAASCANREDQGVMNWLQTKKNVLTASESSMVKSQVMVETEQRLEPIFDHLSNVIKYLPRAEECTEALQRQRKSCMILLEKHGQACESLDQVDKIHNGLPILSLNEFASAEIALTEIIGNNINSVRVDVMEPFQRHKSTVHALRASVTSHRNKRANHIAANSAIERNSVRNPDHDELVAKATRCLNEYVEASNRLDHDYRRYQEERNEGLFALLNSMANLEIQHIQNSQLVWTSLEKSIQADIQQIWTESGNVKSSYSLTSSRSSNAKTIVRETVSSSLLDLQEDDNDDSEYFISV